MEHDVLEYAHSTTAYALGMFTETVNALKEANDHYQVVKEKAFEVIAHHQERHDDANVAQAENNRIIGKIEAFLGKEPNASDTNP